jgi:hypothetical protein
LFNDPNQNPFASYNAATPAAAAPAPAAAPAAAADANQNVFGTKSIEWGGDNESDSNTVRLRDRLQEADTDRRKAQEAADQRERAAEIRREVRLAKIAYMNDMPDSTPAGTGKYWTLR